MVSETSLIVNLECGLPGDLLISVQLGEAEHGIAWERWSQPFDQDRLDAEVSSLKRELRRTIDRDRISERLPGHGRLIFDLLFPSPLKKILRQRRGHLCIVSPDFQVPWNALHDGDGYLAEKWAIGDLPIGAPILTSARAVERALVIADPSGDLPAARYEGEALVRLFAGEGGGACDLRLGPMRKADFLRQFGAYDLIHFAGHGDPSDEETPGGWRFKDGSCSAGDIEQVAGRRAPRFVYANACQSANPELQAAFFRAGVSHQVCTLVDVPDLKGADFASVFYRALHQGQSIGRSMQIATVDSIRQGGTVWLAYVLRGDPRSVFFKARVFHRLPEGTRRAAFVTFCQPALSPEASGFLNERKRLRQQFKSIVQEYGGRVLPGRGAVTRAVFGVPVSYENDVSRAAQAAVSLRAEFETATIVVGFGELAVDGLEVESALFYEAEGLCFELKPGAYALLGARSALRDSVEFGEPRGPVVPIDSLSDQESTHYAPLVGREEPLHRVAHAASACIEGHHGRFVFVVGAAGIGKSHLTHVADGRLGRQFRRFRGRARAYSRGTPYGPYAQILKQLMGADGTPDGASVRAYLRQLDADAVHSTSPVPISIETLLSDEVARQSLEDCYGQIMTLLGHEEQVRAFEAPELSQAFARVVTAEANRSPVALLIGDLHWLPSAGHSMVDELIRASEQAPLLVVATARPGVVESIARWVSHERVTRIDLAPLGRITAEELVRQTAPHADSSTIKAVVSRAEGNPLYLRELALASREGDPLPETIEGVIRARFDRLPLGIRDVLQAAALWGRSFNFPGVSALLEGVADLSVALAALEQGRFIHRTQDVSADSGWRFDHGLLHEVVYAGISEQSRRTWHAKAAAWLRSTADTSQVETLLQIARHHQSAGDLVRSAVSWVECGYRASQSVMPQEAREALKEALAIEDVAPGSLSSVERANALALLGKLEHEAGDLQSADQHYSAAVDLTPSEDVAAMGRRLFERAHVLEAQGAIALAEELVSKALDATSNGPLGGAVRSLQLELRRYGAWLAYRAGDIAGASTGFQALIDEVPDDEPLIMGLALNGLGVAAYGRGEYPEAYQHFEDALARFEIADCQRRRCSAYNNLGMVSAKRGDAQQAIKWYEGALNLHAKAGNRTGLAQTYNNIGTLYGDLGDFSRAEGFLRESVRIREASKHSGLAIGYANLAEVLYRTQKLDDALQYVSRAIRLCETGQGPQYLLPDAHRMLAEIHLAHGDIEDAIAAGTVALALSEKADDAPRRAAAFRALGLACSRAERPADAEQHLRNCIETLEALDQPFELARAYDAMAEHLDSLGAETAENFRSRASALRDQLAL